MPLLLDAVLGLFLLARGPHGAWPQAAGEPLPVLRAEASELDYEIDGVLHARAWHVTPGLDVDVLELPRASHPQRVVFRSTIDALSLEVAPGRELDFLVRIEGQADARTRLSARRPSARRTHAGGQPFVSLPFSRVADERIHVEGRIDGSEPLRFLFDTGSNQLVLFRSGRAKLPGLRIDGTTTSNAAGGAVASGTSDGHRLELGDLSWDDVRLACFDQDADDDGILGYELFTDRVVEIDCEAGALRIHETLPQACAATDTLALRWEGALPAVPVQLVHEGRRTEAWPILDTGAVAGLALSAGFATRNGLPGALRVLGTSRSRGLGPERIRASAVELPGLGFGTTTLAQVPVHVGLDPASDHVAEGLLGMDVLRRFRLWIDFPRNELHLVPGGLLGEPFRRDYDTGRWRWVLAGLGLTGGVAWLCRRRARPTPGGDAGP